ncbi:hypothetical protein MRX96_047349 [Rhipicephalus microplus]
MAGCPQVYKTRSVWAYSFGRVFRVEYEKRNGVNASTASIAPQISSGKENFSVSGRHVLEGVRLQAATETFLAEFLRHTVCLGSKFAIDKKWYVPEHGALYRRLCPSE